MQLVEKGEKIGSGSCGDLYVWNQNLVIMFLFISLSFLCRIVCFIFYRYHGLYQGQEVAIKILKFEHLTHSVEVEFADEVNILR